MSAHTRVILAIGPLNTAGQAYQWAEACRAHDSVRAFSFSNSRRRTRRITGSSHYRAFHHRVRPTLLKQAQSRFLLRSTTHFLDESFATITGDQRSETLDRDIDWLRDEGITVGVVFHGSDVRSPSRHLARQPDSFFHLMDEALVSRIEDSTSRTRRLARASGLPLFVSTPDLLLDLPEATWLPLAVDLSAWTPTTDALTGRRLRFLHSPSRRVPPTKGTSLIDPVMGRLADEGLVDYVSPTRISHAQMPDLVRSVDVVIDQVLTGSYGVAAIEAMSAGRLVIGNVAADVRATVEEPIPIVDCVPASFEELVRSIAADPLSFSRIARQGPRFVERFHSGARSANTLVQWSHTAHG